MTTRPRDPDHPVLQEAWKHEIVGYQYVGLADEPYLDLQLRHAETGAVRRLRFFSPTQVRIRDSGMNWGLAIADIRMRQLQGVGVELYNFEADEGPMELLARDVVEVEVP